MDIENLVRMANDIANFFGADPDRATAVTGVVDHLRKFWDPRMRRAIINHFQTGGEGLNEVALAATERLAHESAALRQTGDG